MSAASSDPFQKMLTAPLQRVGASGAVSGRFRERGQAYPLYPPPTQQTTSAPSWANPTYAENDGASVVGGVSDRKEPAYAASVAPSMYDLPKYPEISNEERLRRLTFYHELNFPNKTPEQVEIESDKKIQDNIISVEQQLQMAEFSNGFMNLKRSAIVPQYCSNLHYGGIYGEASFFLPGGKCVDYRPQNPIQAYGSIFDWAQGGIDIPYAPEPYGDLQNAYLLKYSFANYHNASPVAVGVLLGQMKDNNFIPLERQTWYTEKGYSTYQIDKFHIVLPANTKWDHEVDLYRNTIHINNSYGKDYPFLTSARENILHRCEPQGTNAKNGWLVPLRHAVINWCFHEGNFPEEDMPVESKDHAKKGVFFIVPKKTMEYVIKELTMKASLYIPVTDLRTLTLRFYPLVNGPHSADQYLRDVLDRGHIVDVEWGSSGITAATPADAKRKVNEKELKERYGVTFNAEFFVMYRKIAKDAVDDSAGDDPTPFDVDDD